MVPYFADIFALDHGKIAVHNYIKEKVHIGYGKFGAAFLNKMISPEYFCYKTGNFEIGLILCALRCHLIMY